MNPIRYSKWNPLWLLTLLSCEVEYHLASLEGRPFSKRPRPRNRCEVWLGALAGIVFVGIAALLGWVIQAVIRDTNAMKLFLIMAALMVAVVIVFVALLAIAGIWEALKYRMRQSVAVHRFKQRLCRPVVE